MRTEETLSSDSKAVCLPIGSSERKRKRVRERKRARYARDQTRLEEGLRIGYR